MSTEQVSKQVTYGNLAVPGRQGVLGLPLGESMAGVPFILLIVGMLMKQWYLGAVIVAAVGIIAAMGLLVGRSQGRSIYGRLTMRLMQRRKEKTGNHLYVAGPAGRVPDGTCRLPGLMTASELSEHRDAYGNAFGLLRVKASKHYTVVLEAFPDGDELVDQDRIDSMVAHWGGFLAELGVEEGIAGASVTVESSPDSGFRLRQMTNRNVTDDANEFSAATVRAINAEYQTGSPTFSTRIALTFSGRAIDKDGSDRGLESMADEIANRLPNLIAGLTETGAGTAIRACTAQDIIDFTRSAYDPTVADEIEEARAGDGTGLRWEDAGPVYHRDEGEKYFHDRAVSMSWQMWEGPRGMFFSDCLRRLLNPTPDCLRKRVTILYRPIPAGKATDVLDAELNNAYFVGSQKQRPSARQMQRYRYAQKSSEDEAKGAGVVRFGMLVTVTMASTAPVPKLAKLVPSLSSRARLRLRPAYANQAVAFQAGMPLGVVLPDHMVLPDTVRDFL